MRKHFLLEKADFFSPLRRGSWGGYKKVISFLQKVRVHPTNKNQNYSLEEIYAKMVLVSRDLYLNQREMALWWIILEQFGLPEEVEPTRILYCAAYASKEMFLSNETIDDTYIEKNFVDNFRHLYAYWRQNINFNLPISKNVTTYIEDIPSFLNKTLDYNHVVEGLLSKQTPKSTDSGTFLEIPTGFDWSKPETPSKISETIDDEHCYDDNEFIDLFGHGDQDLCQEDITRLIYPIEEQGLQNLEVA